MKNKSPGRAGATGAGNGRCPLRIDAAAHELSFSQDLNSLISGRTPDFRDAANFSKAATDFAGPFSFAATTARSAATSAWSRAPLRHWITARLRWSGASG